MDDGGGHIDPDLEVAGVAGARHVNSNPSLGLTKEPNVDVVDVTDV